MASIAARVRMRGSTVNRSAGQDAAMRSRLQDTAPFRLPQSPLATFLLSEWVTERWPSRSVPHAASRLLLASSAFGLVPIDQAGRPPSKQSRIGDRYTFPPGSPNSVMSVSHSSLGAARL